MQNYHKLGLTAKTGTYGIDQDRKINKEGKNAEVNDRITKDRNAERQGQRKTKSKRTK
jgi:hypothetical protein